MPTVATVTSIFIASGDDKPLLKVSSEAANEPKEPKQKGKLSFRKL